METFRNTYCTADLRPLVYIGLHVNNSKVTYHSGQWGAIMQTEMELFDERNVIKNSSLCEKRSAIGSSLAWE